MAFDDDNNQWDDCVVKRDFRVCICEEWRVFDEADEINFRSHRGQYSREGYTRGVTNPLSLPREPRRPPPLRGC